MTKAALQRARTSMMDFTIATNPQYRPGWHHQLLCDTLDRVASGEIKRLIVQMPPQHGKSELVSRRFPAYMLGRDPNLRVVLASYAHSLASGFNRDTQRIIDDPIYNLIFPKTRINSKRVVTTQSYLRNNEEFEIVGHRGRYSCAGVGGPLTGKSADLAIIDDPVKDAAEAASPTVRASTRAWFNGVLLTRMSKNGAIILCMTRWHMADLAGSLLEGPNGADWHVLSLPAIAEGVIDPHDPRSEGEALWEEEKPLSQLLEAKATLAAHEWQAMYQQRPVPRGGSMFKPRQWITPEHYVSALPAGIKLVYYWDNAGTQGGGARSAGALVGVKDGRYYIMRVVKGQWSGANREAVKRSEAERARAKYGAIRIRIEQEPGSGGKEQYEASVRNLAGFSVSADKVHGSKELRAEPFATQMEVGNVYIYTGDGTEWLPDVIDELETFPAGTYKDQVDALSGAFAALCEQEKGTRLRGMR